MKECTGSDKQSATQLKCTKTREEIKAEREAKKAAKAAAKGNKIKSSTNIEGSLANNVTSPVTNANKETTIVNTSRSQEENGNQQPTHAIVEGLQRISLPNDKINDNSFHGGSVTDNNPINQVTSKKLSDVLPANSKPTRISDTVDGCMVHRKGSLLLSPGVSVIEKKDNVLPPVVNDLEIPSKEDTGKSKAELRAERRAKQEAQRAAKAAGKSQPVPDKSAQSSVENDIRVNVLEVDKKEVKPVVSDGLYKVKIFSHLYFEKKLIHEDYGVLHPSIIQLGVQYENRIVCGSNARCLALLHALKKAIKDYSTPLKQEFSRGLESMLGKSMAYLDHHRPASVSMVNAVKHIKRHLTQIPNTLSDLEAKQKLYDIIDTYVREQIDVAGEAISNTVQKKITNGDVILIYGCSSLIYRILVESHKSGTNFSVVVVDGGPLFEGREMLRRLVREGLHCSYVLISAASFVMREVSKVLLGAHAILANGYVMSRAGTSQVALLAHSYNVAVLVCCETHKFSERVQTDAFVHNELGDPDQMLTNRKGRISQWRSYNHLTPLSLAYDVTPPDLVTAVVTELGILPCTSVPVILRIKPSESVV